MNKIQRKLALTAGFSLIAMAIAAGVGYGFAFGNIFVPNDAEATLFSLNSSPFLLRLVIFSFLTILVLDVVVAWAFYIFFKPANEPLSLLTAWMRIVYAALLGVAISSLSQSSQLLSNVPQNEVLILNGIMTFQQVWSWGLIVFSTHLFLLGYLVIKADYVPKILGILVVLAAACYFFTHTTDLLWPAYDQYKDTVDTILSLPMALGELALAVWLLWKGGEGNS